MRFSAIVKPTFLSLMLIILILPASASAYSGITSSQLVPPPEPTIFPIISHPKEIDADSNKIDDRLEARINAIHSMLAFEYDPIMRSALEAALDEPVRVELIFSRQITQNQIDAFLSLGGSIEYIYKAVSYGWVATLPIRIVESLQQKMGSSFVAVITDSPTQLHLDEATQTGRVRPIWSPGFAGSALGYSGSSNTTIGIIDSGVDDSHTDLTGRKVYWRDWTSDNESNPRDITGHGTHVAGIALGSGSMAGSTTPTLLYTDSGSLSGVPTNNFIPSTIHIPNGLVAIFNSVAIWNGNSATLYAFRKTNGSTGSYSSLGSVSGSSPLTNNRTFTSSSTYLYSVGLVQTNPASISLYSIINTVTYAGVGDGFNTFHGVAPMCKWACAKAMKNDGSGSSIDIGQAVDDLVNKRSLHNVKIMNISLGIIGDPGLDTILRNKVNSAVDNGIVVVVSAGNDGPGTAGKNAVDDPGRASQVITVGASNDVNQLTNYTSSGFSSSDSSEDMKPDLIAPGGSSYYSRIMSVDTNDADADSTSFPDQRANDYANMQGTSMSAPFVAGSAALVIQALEDNGLIWTFSGNTQSLLVKMLLCATCTETNTAREAGFGADPTLGRASAPKDLYEGYGIINPDAAIEAVSIPFIAGNVTNSTSGGHFDRRAWGRKLSLINANQVNLSLDVPSTGDFDIYIYSSTPNSKGNPVVRASSTLAGNGTDEVINFSPTATETAFLVIKRVSGNGTWTLSGSTVTDIIAPTPGTASSPQYATASPISVTYSGASDTGGSGLKYVHLYYKKGTGTWSDSLLTAQGASGSFNFTNVSGEGTYYFALRAEDYNGNWSPAPSGNGSDNTIFDTTAPTTPVVIDTGAYINTTNQLHANWSAADPLTGIAEYQYAISTTTSPSNIITGGQWQSVGTQVQHTRTGLSLTYGQVYYILVKCLNNAGLWSSVGVSDGITVVQNVPPTISEAKELSNTLSLGLSSKTVTAVYANAFYIEEVNRLSAIKVTPIAMPTGLVIGKSVDIGGKMQVINGERHIGTATVEIIN